MIWWWWIMNIWHLIMKIREDENEIEGGGGVCELRMTRLNWKCFMEFCEKEREATKKKNGIDQSMSKREEG